MIKYNKFSVLCIVLIYLLFISSCSGKNQNQGVVQENIIQEEYVPFDTRVFTGADDAVSDFFSLSPGLVKFSFEHIGSSNFAVVLKDSSGNYIDLLANEIGSYRGETLVTIPYSDNYILDIDADGTWTITISDPKGASTVTRAVLSANEPSCEKQQPKEPFMEWDAFFEACKQQYPSQYFKSAPLIEKYTDECRNAYVRDYLIVEECDNIKGHAAQAECYFFVAIATRNKDICAEHLLGSEKAECVRSVSC